VWMKLPGDANINRARVKGLHAGIAFREALEDEKSVESKAYIPDASKKTKSELLDVTLALMIPEFNLKAMREISIPYPSEPTDPSIESMSEYQKEVDAYSAKFSAELVDLVTAMTEVEKKRLNKATKAQVLDVYRESIISELHANRFDSVYKGWCIHFAAFRDEACTKRIFETYEDYDNAPVIMKTQFIEFLNDLDISSADLKK